MKAESEMLCDLASKRSSKIFLARLNEKRLGSTRYGRAHLSLWKRGRRPIPQEVQVFIRDDYLQRNTPYGSFFVINDPSDSPPFLPLLLDGLRKANPDLKAVLGHAMAVQAAGKEVQYGGVEVKDRHWAILAALIGTLQRQLGDTESALRSFEDAKSFSEKSAPDLMPRYSTNFLNAQRESYFKDKTKTESEYHIMLAHIFDEQGKLLNLAKKADDKKLIMKHLMRLASLLNKKKDFEAYLRQARRSDAFGTSETERDAYLIDWLDPSHDIDGDFDNARKWDGYRQLIDTQPKRKKRSAVAVLTLLLALTAISIPQAIVDEVGATVSPIYAAKLGGGDYGV